MLEGQGAESPGWRVEGLGARPASSPSSQTLGSASSRLGWAMGALTALPLQAGGHPQAHCKESMAGTGTAWGGRDVGHVA